MSIVVTIQSERVTTEISVVPYWLWKWPRWSAWAVLGRGFGSLGYNERYLRVGKLLVTQKKQVQQGEHLTRERR
jgi:hypothetical protein